MWKDDNYAGNEGRYGRTGAMKIMTGTKKESSEGRKTCRRTERRKLWKEGRKEVMEGRELRKMWKKGRTLWKEVMEGKKGGTEGKKGGMEGKKEVTKESYGRKE